MPNKYKLGNKGYVQARRAEVYKIINQYKSKPCVDCGKTYPPYVMDFDHIGQNKFKNVSKLTTYKTERVLEEINKCEVVCANCHRIRTHNRSTVAKMVDARDC